MGKKNYLTEVYKANFPSDVMVRKEDKMPTSNELSDSDCPKLLMKPAISSIFCCSVTAASGFVAAYALVRYQFKTFKFHN